MKRTLISRRAMLKGTGAALSLPLMKIMSGRERSACAASQSDDPPQRVAFFYIPNGVVQSTWNPVDTGTDFQLSPTLEPLAELRSDILMLSNLDRIKTSGTDGHAQASTCWLSSAAPDELSPAGYPLKRTVDQLIADHVGKETAFRSLELSCNPYEDNRESVYFDNISWYGHGHVARSMRDPKEVFDRLFRVDSHVASGSILDLVMEDANTFRRQLGVNDRDKLDEYTDAVRNVERQIQRVRARQEEINRLNLDAPVKPWQAMHRDEFIQVMGDLMILALQTDMTRVASLMTGPERWGSPLMVDGWFDKAIDHHGWTHNQGNETIKSQLEKLDRFHIEQYARLVKKMSEVKEGEGTLLDNMMFLLGGGLSSGELHICSNLPTLIAGRAGGRLATGQHIKYAEGTPIANLWMSMTDLMGASHDRIGDSTGSLTDIMA